MRLEIANLIRVLGLMSSRYLSRNAGEHAEHSEDVVNKTKRKSYVALDFRIISYSLSFNNAILFFIAFRSITQLLHRLASLACFLS